MKERLWAREAGTDVSSLAMTQAPFHEPNRRCSHRTTTSRGYGAYMHLMYS
jgi:hypothetical protein